jgi:hypothetical protein
VTPQGIDALVTRARHTGITSFFITNTPTALPEGVLRAADNLFVFRLPLEEDIKWVAKSGMIEESSLPRDRFCGRTHRKKAGPRRNRP